MEGLFYIAAMNFSTTSIAFCDHCSQANTLSYSFSWVCFPEEWQPDFITFVGVFLKCLSENLKDYFDSLTLKNIDK